MPIEYTIRPDEAFVATRISGDITLADILEYRRALRADPAYSPAYSRLVDLTDARLLMTPQDLRTLAESLVSEGLGTARRAFVAKGDLEYGLFRMLELLSDDSSEQWRTFRSEEEAMEWLRS